MQALPRRVGLMGVVGPTRCWVASVSSAGLTSWLVKRSWRLRSRAASVSTFSLTRCSHSRVHPTIACTQLASS